MSSPQSPTSLWNRGFVALLLTQFSVAFNDNLFRWLIIPIGKCSAGWEDKSDLILSLGAATFLLPFLVLASTAGFCTDRFARRDVMIGCKIAEVILIILGVAAVLAQSVPAMLTVLCLLGAQSAFFSPSKYGILPDIVPHEQLTNANGIIAMTTMIAVIGGQMLGGFLFELTTPFTGNHIAVAGQGGMGGAVGSWIWIVAIVGIAFGGMVTSFFVTYFPAVDPAAKLHEPITQTYREMAALAKHPALFILALGSAFFWGLGAFAQLNIDKFGESILHIAQDKAMILMGLLSLGIAIGSVLAGLLSRRRLELGIVPCGAFGIAICGLALGITPDVAAIGRDASFWTYSTLYAAVFLFLLGIFAGIYDIPMVTFIQQNSPVVSRGRILASVNFLSFTAMFLSTPIFWGLTSIGLSASHCFFVVGVVVLVLFGLLTYYFLVPFVAFVARTVLARVYHRTIHGLENIPSEGPAIFVGNHVSFLDGFVVYTSLPTAVRFVAHADFIPRGFWSYFGTRLRTLRIRPGKEVVHVIREARDALKNGERLVIFAEGGITRVDQIKGFERGFLSFLKNGNEDVPIVPFYIGGLFGSMFSYANGGKMSWIPRRLRDSVMIAFGKPIVRPQAAQQVQQAVEELAVDARTAYNRKPPLVPSRLAMRRCKEVGRRLFFADSTGLELSGYKMLTAILIARHLLKKRVLSADEQNVGTLLPMSVGGCVTNAAITFSQRTAVNLNYTFGSDILNRCIEKVGIQHILTTRKLLQRFPNLQLDAELICMEDLLPQATTLLKLVTLLQVMLIPSWLHERMLGIHRTKQDDNIAILFTSGSTGEPKGVQLTHNNIAEEAYSFIVAQHIDKSDTLLGILPIFHAFGYAGNFWLTILSGCRGVFHYNPLEPKMVGEMARKYQCTFMPSTPTFLRNYLRRCPKEDFQNLEGVMTGAEKLPVDLMDAWEEKFGNRPGEGFGATELSPCATTNIPPSRQVGTFHTYLKDRSIGTAIAHVAAKIVDPETGEDLPPNTDGMFVVKGPIVMKGYYGEPERTAAVIKNGWYWTGDIARRDEDGFFFITGRQTRMSKIGGEMVPHILVEETLLEIVAAAQRNVSDSATDDADGVALAVASVPDVQKGEQLVVLHRPLPVGLTVEAIRSQMRDRNLPNIWIPSATAFYEVSSIPILGTGKLDLAAVKKLALQITGNEKPV
ncbi:MAG: MFS transporter [Thermoguttaceae bacterium]